MSVRILTGDCLDVMPTLDADSVDAIVCDPPYGLSFMGKAWDHGVPGVPFWEAARRVAKPGAYLLAFGGTRTYHRLACAIEDAGWRIQDTLSWLYGSGFPKHRSKLKPAWEPIIMAWKPDAKATPLNIDACRITTTDVLTGSWDTVHMRGGNYGNGRDGEASANRRYVESGGTSFAPTPGARGGDTKGRWPANVVLDEEAAAALNEQSGELTSGFMSAGTQREGIGYHGALGNTVRNDTRGDSGGASRFFYTAKAARSERDAGLTGERKPLLWSAGTQNPGSFQSANTDRSAKNAHPTVKPIELMRWLCKLVTPSGGLILDPFTGSGSTGCAAVLEGFAFLGIEREAEYAEIARARIAHHATLFAPSLFTDGTA